MPLSESSGGSLPCYVTASVTNRTENATLLVCVRRWIKSLAANTLKLQSFLFCHLFHNDEHRTVAPLRSSRLGFEVSADSGTSLSGFCVRGPMGVNLVCSAFLLQEFIDAHPASGSTINGLLTVGVKDRSQDACLFHTADHNVLFVVLKLIQSRPIAVAGSLTF